MPRCRRLLRALPRSRADRGRRLRAPGRTSPWPTTWVRRPRRESCRACAGRPWENRRARNRPASRPSPRDLVRLLSAESVNDASLADVILLDKIGHILHHALLRVLFALDGVAEVGPIGGGSKEPIAVP